MNTSESRLLNIVYLLHHKNSTIDFIENLGLENSLKAVIGFFV